MASHNLRLGIDLPVFQQLAWCPIGQNYHGTCFVYDNRRYIYALYGYGSSLFYRYDIYTDGWTQLSSSPVAPSTSGYASDMTYCHTRRRIYVAFGGSTDFRYYDVETDTWSAALSAFPILPAGGACLKHTCTFHEPTANDDIIYYINGDSSQRKLRKYTISTNTWVEVGTDIIPGATGSGSNMLWLTGLDPDLIVIPRGAGTKTCYLFSISQSVIVGALDLKQFGGNINTASLTAYEPTTQELFFVDASWRMGKVKMNLGALLTGTVTTAGNTFITDSTKNIEEDKYVRVAYITITGGIGSGQTRRIVSNKNDRFDVYPAWSVNPDSTSTYELKFSVIDYGQATSATTNTLTDSTKVWGANAIQNTKVKIIKGTGVGQERFITSNTATQITVTVNWTVQPDSTSIYEIIGYKVLTEPQFPYSPSQSYVGNTMITAVIKGLLFVYIDRKQSQGEWWRYLVTSP